MKDSKDFGKKLAKLSLTEEWQELFEWLHQEEMQIFNEWKKTTNADKTDMILKGEAKRIDKIRSKINSYLQEAER